MKLTTNILASLVTIILMTGCGSSEFGSSGKVEKANSETDSHAEKNESSDDTQNQSGKTDPELDEIGDLSSDGEADAHTAETTEGDAEGCSFPDDVKAKVGSGSGFALGDWGGTGSGGAELALKNLDLNDCEWFGLVKSEAKPRYLLVVNRDDNSFVEPWAGEVNGLNFAQCLSKAASLSSMSGVQASCQFAPIDK
jgi:hypothetical protein